MGKCSYTEPIDKSMIPQKVPKPRMVAFLYPVGCEQLSTIGKNIQQGSLYYQPKQCTIIREILPIYHTFAF